MEQINFTEQAAKKVYELISEEGNFNLKLRVFVTGGGCSGFKYGFAFEEEVSEDDVVITRSISTGDTSESLHLIIDALSYQYLRGAEIDYKQDLEGEQFIIRNPNAKSTCGCGSSFSLEDDQSAS